jgi:hypothetical protein
MNMSRSHFGLSLLLAGTVLLALVGPVAAAVAPAAVDKPAAAPAAPKPKVQVTARYQQSVRGLIDDLPFVVLRGTLEQRAEACGALCGKDCIDMMNNVIMPTINKVQPGGWQILSLLTMTLFANVKDDERQAVAFIEGLKKGVPEKDQVLPALGRPLAPADLRVAQGFVDILGAGFFNIGGCSSFSVWGAAAEGGGTISGRNSDYITYPGHFPMMVVAQQPAEKGLLATIEVSGPGVFGVSTAMNEEGVVVMLHDEPGLPVRLQRGFWPRISALRVAAEKAHAATAVKDIAEALAGKPPMVGCNVHVSMPVTKDGPLPSVLEWDGAALTGGVTVRGPEGTAASGSIVCTNHYLKRRAAPPGCSPDSERRYNLLTDTIAGFRKAQAAIGLEKAEAMMHSVSRSGDFVTYLTVIAFPETRKMVVALSPKTGVSATRGHWVEVDWKTVFEAK